MNIFRTLKLPSLAFFLITSESLYCMQQPYQANIYDNNVQERVCLEEEILCRSLELINITKYHAFHSKQLQNSSQQNLQNDQKKLQNDQKKLQNDQKKLQNALLMKYKEINDLLQQYLQKYDDNHELSSLKQSICTQNNDITSDIIKYLQNAYINVITIRGFIAKYDTAKENIQGVESLKSNNSHDIIKYASNVNEIISTSQQNSKEIDESIEKTMKNALHTAILMILDFQSKKYDNNQIEQFIKMQEQLISFMNHNINNEHLFNMTNAKTANKLYQSLLQNNYTTISTIIKNTIHNKNIITTNIRLRNAIHKLQTIVNFLYGDRLYPNNNPAESSKDLTQDINKSINVTKEYYELTCALISIFHTPTQEIETIEKYSKNIIQKTVMLLKSILLTNTAIDEYHHQIIPVFDIFFKNKDIIILFIQKTPEISLPYTEACITTAIDIAYIQNNTNHDPLIYILGSLIDLYTVEIKETQIKQWQNFSAHVKQTLDNITIDNDTKKVATILTQKINIACEELQKNNNENFDEKFINYLNDKMDIDTNEIPFLNLQEVYDSLYEKISQQYQTENVSLANASEERKLNMMTLNLYIVFLEIQIMFNNYTSIPYLHQKYMLNIAKECMKNISIASTKNDDSLIQKQ